MGPISVDNFLVGFVTDAVVFGLIKLRFSVKKFTGVDRKVVCCFFSNEEIKLDFKEDLGILMISNWSSGMLNVFSFQLRDLAQCPPSEAS